MDDDDEFTDELFAMVDALESERQKTKVSRVLMVWPR